ncbi:MAG: type II toxin-antitoxin system Phd/YefM family antitoxin [Anaerolineae bacterium]|nr:type II toxin-antitoxin system Phd/YefM family antitoxin [Anaerolineae bacterium]
MIEVSLDDIKRDLLTYLRRVENGETLVIMKTGKPLAELRPIVVGAKQLRPVGLCAGEFQVPADFDDPLPDHVIQAFEGQ